MTSTPAMDDLHVRFLQQVNEALDRLTLGNHETPRTGDARHNQPRYRHIVLAYDGSEGSQRALEWAKDLARAYGAKVTVASAFASPQVTNAGAMGAAWYPDYVEAYGALERTTRRGADDAVELLRELGVEASPLVTEGNAGREIARMASDKRADLIVVGATRAGRLHRALLGSTADALLTRAPCNVLIARGAPRPHRMLVATDGSRVSYRAVAHAYHRASQTSAELVVQHVLDYPTQTVEDVPPEGFVKAVAQRLELPAPPPKVRYVLDVGHPASRILLRASEENAGLVVVGAHGKAALERFFVGSTSRRVANESPASVLVVKDG